MRQVAWLAGCVLVLSCTVNTSNLDVDLPGSGGSMGAGGAIGTGGQIATGGETGTGGQIATGGQTGTGGQADIGGQAGAGGQTAAAGHSGGGGRRATGGQSGAAGHTDTGGQTGTAGQAGGGPGGEAGQMGAGGKAGIGGQGGGDPCTQLQTQYSTALSAAKACTLGAGNQCQQLVDTSLSCQGCQAYVNDTTQLDALAAEWAKAGCDQLHFVCPAIACVVPQAAHCAAQAATAGPGGSCSSTQSVPFAR